jgi:dTDP-4-dehydrorhamnose 3,5-epimerase
MPFIFEKLEIPEVILIRPHSVEDSRGLFMETYKHSEFRGAGIEDIFVQQNQSSSARGVLRGLHYQHPPYSQAKLVRVLSGEIFDVAVDLRPDSPTAGKWVGVTLSAANRQMVYLPSWCAHGFCVLSERADVLYLATPEYTPGHESGFMWNDPRLAIRWPVSAPILSERDRNWPTFTLQKSES